MRHFLEKTQIPCFSNPCILNNLNLLATQEQPMHPEPSQDQHDEGDGETEQKPCSKIHHFSLWVVAVKEKKGAQEVRTVKRQAPPVYIDAHAHPHIYMSRHDRKIVSLCVCNSCTICA